MSSVVVFCGYDVMDVVGVEGVVGSSQVVGVVRWVLVINVRSTVGVVS